ncbi:MAG: GNAT family N-acetyltransferase [Woeseia sp.]
MQVEIHDSIAEIDTSAWNRLAGGDFPFLRHEFLSAAEKTGCVSPSTGWTPRHVALYGRGGEIRAAMPLYEKSHSWGEFVFDWSWAQAYQRAGFDYYPKLVSAVPFTPAPSSRLLLGERERPGLASRLVGEAVRLAKDSDCSSLHVLFPRPDELQVLRDSGLQLRKDCQFHWHNQEYLSFDDFLGTFSSAKRKKAKRERRRVAESGITFRWVYGEDADPALWRDVYRLISITFLRHGSMPYFDLDFFVDVSRHIPRTVLLVLAEKNDMLIAAAVFYESDSTLYGRYWGSDARYNALHFETCYYQGIEYCIANNKTVFEPGTQGEHKLARGFVPTATWSAHWLARPEFYAAIRKYLLEEGRYIEQYMDAAGTHTPYRAADRES